MLDKEYKYFKKHEAEFLQKYQGRFILIKGEEVVGDFETEVQAYQEGVNKYGLGNFMLKQCVPGADRQTFHTRAIFS
jgi:hypothetical protein